MSTTKVLLNIASDFLRYVNQAMLNNQYLSKDTTLPVPPIVTRAKNLTTKSDVLVVTLESENTNG